MNREQSEFKAHLFICTHKRDGKDSCGPQGGEELVDELKKWAKHEGLKKDVKVSRSGCLGHCEKGVVAVCYPSGAWYTKLKHKDKDQLIEDLRAQAGK
jgi:(2Fe-2S) ferredoxin